MAFIDDEILKCVGFIGYKTLHDGKYHLRGSVFFIGTEEMPENEGKSNYVYWVTARHVIDKIKALGCEHVQVRMNSKDGGAYWIETKTSDWFVDPDDPTRDIAILSRGIPTTDDHACIGSKFHLTDEVQERMEFGITDEVAVLGLFWRRFGQRRNIPIARVGTIASLNDEDLVATQLGLAPIYLIEARSIGGLSGSPVFVHVGINRAFSSKVSKGEPNLYLIGLIHGHYDVKSEEIDQLDDADLSVANVNTGIAMVTPFFRLDELVAKHKEYLKQKLAVPFVSFDALGETKLQFDIGGSTDQSYLSFNLLNPNPKEF